MVFGRQSGVFVGVVVGGRGRSERKGMEVKGREGKGRNA